MGDDEKEVEKLEAELEEKESEISELEADLESERSTVEEQSTQIEEQSTRIEELEADLEAKRTELEEAKSDLEAKRTELEDLEAALESTQTDVTDLYSNYYKTGSDLYSDAAGKYETAEGYAGEDEWADAAIFYFSASLRFQDAAIAFSNIGDFLEEDGYQEALDMAETAASAAFSAYEMTNLFGQGTRQMRLGNEDKAQTKLDEAEEPKQQAFELEPPAPEEFNAALE
jgi:multidrug resistance efflux pump